MDDYPNPDDEFEMLHAEEMEAMKEMEDFDEAASVQAASIPPSYKRSLNFTSPQPSTPPTSTINTNSSSTTTNDTASTSITNSNTSFPNSTSTDTFRSEVPLIIDDWTADAPVLTQLGGGNNNSNNRKRPPDDGFEDSLDLSSLLDPDNNNRRKRSRPLVPMVDVEVVCQKRRDLAEEEENDLRLIDRISALRTTLVQDHARQARSKAGGNTRSSATTPVIHRHLPMTGGFQAITTGTGERFYLGRLEEEEWEASVVAAASDTGTTIRLTGSSYEQLKAQAEREQIRRDALLAKRVQEAEDSGLESGVEEDGEEAQALWVERFKPKHYLDLLSDESINRTVLHWVKLWDKLVFGINKKPKKKNDENKKDKPFKKFPMKGVPEVVEELDEQNKPVQKVLLLAGPPGLGKTTLAHVLGRHAGYHTVELNSSNDRSPEAFRVALETAATMRSVIGATPKPNCLVMDEIDGAPAPSINLLVNMLTGKDTGRKTKKGKKEVTVLQRPVICICNDMYAPALRPLRQISLVVQFPPTHSARLAQRLLEVAKTRDLKADLSVLRALCDKTENDIRACLSVLQFVRSSRRVVRLEDVTGSSVGQKDHQRSLFTMWNDIFSIPRQKKIRRNILQDVLPDGSLPPMPELSGDLTGVGEDGGLGARISRVLRTTFHAPYDKLTQGWFHNYLMVKTASLDTITQGLDWAGFTDMSLSEIHHSQSWVLMGYLPYACVSYHLLFATHQNHKIQFPMRMSEVNQKLTKMENLIASQTNEMPAVTRALLNPPSPSRLVCDVLPFLMHIIQPNLRPVNTQLYSKQEKAELKSLIDTMLAYNLTYTQERDMTGQYAFNLDPNIEEVVEFPEIKSGRQLSYPMRQLVSREVELERVRRAEAYFTAKENEASKYRSNRESQQKKDTSTSASKPTTTKPTPTASVVPNHLKKLQAKPLIDTTKIKGATKVLGGEVVQAARDFFGRVVDQPAHQIVKDTTNEIVKSDIWFRFKEGYSNAVRRTIRMKDLA